MTGINPHNPNYNKSIAIFHFEVIIGANSNTALRTIGECLKIFRFFRKSVIRIIEYAKKPIRKTN